MHHYHKQTMTNAKLQEAMQATNERIRNITPPAPVFEFKAMKVSAHPRQAEIDAYKKFPSRFV